MKWDYKQSKRVFEHREVYRGKLFSMCTDQVEVVAGETVVRRDYLKHPGAVGVVALRETAGDAEVLLVRQYRHPVQAQLWELPAGLLDIEGEDPLQAARRELAEEADLSAEHWDVLVDLFTSPGCSSESLRVYLARGLSEIPESQRHLRSEEEKEMVSRWVGLEDAARAIHAGLIHNPAAIAGIMSARSAAQQGWSNLRSTNSEWLR